MLLDLLVATGASYLWLGLLDLALGVGVAASVVAVTGGHRPLVVRAGVGLLALFILVFAANLILVSVPGWA